MKLSVFFVCLGFIATSNVFAYETSTHAAMTAAAITQSKLTANPHTSPVIAQLGLTAFIGDEPFWRRYIALAPTPVQRFGTTFEKAWFIGDSPQFPLYSTSGPIPEGASKVSPRDLDDGEA